MPNGLELLGSIATVSGISLASVTALLAAAARWIRQHHVITHDKRRLGPDYDNAVRSFPYEKTWPTSVYRKVEKRKQEVITSLRAHCLASFNNSNNRLAAGSRSLTYADVIGGADDSLSAIGLSVRGAPQTSTAKELARSFRYDLFRNGRFCRGVTLLGDPGQGKTFFTKVLVDAVFREGPTGLIPVVIDGDTLMSSTVPLDRNVGSVRWVREVLLYRSAPSVIQLDDHLLDRIIQDNTVIIVDALDEILDVLEAPMRSVFLGSWTMSNASWVTCRESDYTLDVRANLPRDIRLEASIISTSESGVRTLIRSVRTALSLQEVDGSQGQSPVFPQILRQANIRWTPLLVIMASELGKGASGNIEPHQNLDSETALFSLFVTESIRKEVGSSHARFSDRLRLVLQDVAAAMAGYIGDVSLMEDGVSASELAKIVDDSSNALSSETLWIINKVLHDSAICGLASVESGILRFNFRHKSFREFLVAERLYTWLLGVRGSGSDFFDLFETPLTSFYVKEFISLIKVREAVRCRALQRLTALLEECGQSGLSLRTGYPSTFRRGQIAYHICLLTKRESDGKLIRQMLELGRADDDAWIMHAVASGLAYAGIVGPLDEYVDALKTAALVEDTARLRAFLSIQLTYYGDFSGEDLLSVDRVFGGCEGLVLRISAELGLDIERPHRRLAVVTLFIVATCIPELATAFREAVKLAASELRVGLLDVKGAGVETDIVAALITIVEESSCPS